MKVLVVVVFVILVAEFLARLYLNSRRCRACRQVGPRSVSYGPLGGRFARCGLCGFEWMLFP